MATPFANALRRTVLNYPGYGSKDPHYFRAPKRVGTVTYPSILKSPNNSADYLIITSPDFYDNADLKRLATHRVEYNGFDVAIVSTTNIYNEFPPPQGTGTQDISIKNFIEYAYNIWKASSMADNHLGYVLIFGDAELGPNLFPPGYVPTHRGSGYSGIPCASDIWYTYLNESDLTEGYLLPDIMLGRLPLQMGTEAKILVDKIIQFEKNPVLGQWQNRALLVDGVESPWVTRNYVKDNILIPAGFEVTVIDGDQGGNGDDVYNAINNGQLLVAYQGHGNFLGWAVQFGVNVSFCHRHVEKLSNGGMLPIIFAVACDTACFNDVDDSLGELFIKKENGGGIAYWGASTISGPYEIWIKEAYDFMAENNPYTFCLGEVVINAYIRLHLLYEEFNLLGEPAVTTARVPPEQDKAELEIQPTDVCFIPPYPKPGQLTTITTTIHNYGGIDAGNVLVKFFLDEPKNGIEIGSKTITTIKAKDKGIVDISWTPDLPVGEYKFYVVVDPYDTIPEAGTINNIAYKPLEINYYQDGWPKYLQGISLLSQAVGDIDGDGDLEIVALDRTCLLYFWHHDGSLQPGWPKKIVGEEKISQIILADIDNDDRLEIVVSGDKLYVWNDDGSDVPGFPKEMECSSSPAIGDIDGDGELEIVVELKDNGDNKLYAFHNNGSIVSGDWPKDDNYNYPIVVNLDGKQGDEIISSKVGHLYIWDGTGKILLDCPKSISDRAVGNLDEDKEPEIIGSTYDYYEGYKVYALNYDGSDLPGWPKKIDGNQILEIMLGDIDNDKDMEVIVSAEDPNKLYVFHHNGSDVVGWPKEGIIGRNDFGKLADVDMDNKPEIITPNGGTITIWEDTGNIKASLFTRPTDYIISFITIADIDADGDIEMIGMGKEPENESVWRKLYIWDYWGSCTAGALEWPMANHDMRRTNCYNTDIVPSSRITDLKALNPKPTSIDLTWTAPGDDKDKGSSTCYYIRYATFTITPQNWHLTNKATSTIVPKDAGSPESFTVTNLSPTTTYYFCIRARDDDFNTSPLSNNATGITLSPAVITLISPIYGPVGSLVTIKGANFYPTETIRISFGNTITIALTTAENGSLTTTFTVDDQGFGTITIIAYGLDSEYIATGYFVIPPPEYFKIGTISSPQIAGQGFSIKITAYDEHGDIVQNFKEAVLLSDLSQTIQPTITSNFTGGIWDGTVSLTRASTTAITAGYQGKTGTSNPFYVRPGEPFKFIVYPENPVYILAGGSVSITAQLSDVYGNAVGSAGVSCNLEVVVLSGKPGTLSATTSTTTNTGQIGTITYWVSPNANDKVRIKLLSTLPPATSGTITTTSGELAMFTFDIIATQTAGMNFPIKITARDAYENPIPFTRTVTLIDLSNSLKPTQTTSFIDGMWDGSGSITVRGTTSITAIYGHIRGTSNTFWVCGGEVEYFVISTITPQTAGISFPVSINAYDRWRNIADMFNSSATLTDTSRTISPPKTTNFSLGIWDGTVSITRAGTSAITASYQGKTGTSNPFLVNHNSLAHFLIGTMSNCVAGVPFPITIIAQDAYGNTVLNFSDKVQLEDSSLTLNPKLTTNFMAGIWDSIGSITRAGTTSITASYQGKTGTSNPFLVSHNSLAHFLIGTISNCLAGVNFAIRIMAQDSYGNTMLNFSDKVQLEDTSLSLNPKLTTNFVAGIWNGIGSITRAGTTAITAGYQGKTGTSNPFLVSHNRLDHFLIGTISNCVAGVPFPITIIARDAYGNTVLNFSDKVQLEDTSLTLNPKITTNFMAGIWAGIGSITRTGTTAITAGYQGKTGTSNPFLVQAGSLSLIKVMPESVTLLPDKSQLFTTRGYDSNGNEKEVGDGKWEVGKEIGNLSNIFGTMTTFTAGTKAASGIIKVSAEGVIGTANIRIVPGKLAKITILPKDVVVEVSGTSTFTAYGYDKYGNEKEVENGQWEVGSELGELTNVIGTNTTFVAGTKPGKGTLTYTVREVVMNLHLTNESVPLGMWIKGEERNNLPEPRVPSPEPRAPNPEPRTPSPESRAP
ncbi:MAG: C25 family cysteine peptidase, partial [bacterium]